MQAYTRIACPSFINPSSKYRSQDSDLLSNYSLVATSEIHSSLSGIIRLLHHINEVQCQAS